MMHFFFLIVSDKSLQHQASRSSDSGSDWAFVDPDDAREAIDENWDDCGASYKTRNRPRPSNQAQGCPRKITFEWGTTVQVHYKREMEATEVKKLETLYQRGSLEGAWYEILIEEENFFQKLFCNPSRGFLFVDNYKGPRNYDTWSIASFWLGAWQVAQEGNSKGLPQFEEVINPVSEDDINSIRQMTLLTRVSKTPKLLSGKWESVVDDAELSDGLKKTYMFTTLGFICKTYFNGIGVVPFDIRGVRESDREIDGVFQVRFRFTQ